MGWYDSLYSSSSVYLSLTIETLTQEEYKDLYFHKMMLWSFFLHVYSFLMAIQHKDMGSNRLFLPKILYMNCSSTCKASCLSTDSLERATAGIDLYVNAHKTECMCFNQTGDISTLGGSSLKLVDEFTYIRSSVSSTEKDVDTRLAKPWTAIGSYRSYGSQTWPIKWNAVSSKQWSCRYCYMDALHGRWVNGRRKSLTATTQKCCEQF